MGGVVRIAKNLFSGSTPFQKPAEWAVDRAIAKPGALKDAVDEQASLAPEVEAPPAIEEETKTLLKKKKKGRYNTILSGKEGSLGAANVERKSLLGN